MSLTIIIGGASTVSFPGATCVVSAQWGFNPGRQDAFCLGSFLPSAVNTIYKPQQTLSVTIYAPGNTHAIPASTTCDNASTISASVSPATCLGNVEGVSGSWFVTGYSFSKESRDAPGQESWSLQKWTGISNLITDNVGKTVEPTSVIRGISQGQATDLSLCGISFTSEFAESNSGSVSAGGLGKAQTMIYGTVNSVGGGTSSMDEQATGSVTIPYTPLYY